MSTNWFTGLQAPTVNSNRYGGVTQVTNDIAKAVPESSVTGGGNGLQGIYTPTSTDTGFGTIPSSGTAGLSSTPIQQYQAPAQPAYTRPSATNANLILAGSKQTPQAATANPRYATTGTTAATGTTATNPTSTTNAVTSALYPQTPNFAPSTYTQTNSPYYEGTSTQPTLDSYLRSGLNSYFNPSAIEQGTAVTPDQLRANLTSSAQNYLKLNPGVGSANDISTYVDQYTKMYSDWYNGQNAWYKANSGSVALPAGSPLASGTQPSSGSTIPASTTTGTSSLAAQNAAQNGNQYSLQDILRQILGSQSGPQYGVSTTPLGYTQYQQTSAGSGGIDQNSLLALITALMSGNQSPTRNSFWNLGQ